MELRSVGSRFAKAFQRDLLLLMQVSSPERVLAAGEPVVLENLKPKEAPAQTLAIENAVAPQDIDEYLQHLRKTGLPKEATGLVVLKGRFVLWPGEHDSRLRMDVALPSRPLARRGAKLYGSKGFIYWHSVGDVGQLPRQGDARHVVVVGQLCREWEGSYVLLSLGAWPAASPAPARPAVDRRSLSR